VCSSDLGSAQNIGPDWHPTSFSLLSHLWRQQEGEIQIEIKWMGWKSPSGKQEVVRTCMIPPMPMAVVPVGNGRLKLQFSDRVYVPHARWDEAKGICWKLGNKYACLKSTPEWAAFEMQQAEDQRRDGGGSTSVDSDGFWNN
jgi:hypothetical protein